MLAACLADARQPLGLMGLAFIAAGALVCTRTRARTVLLRLVPLGSFALLGVVLLLIAPPQEGTPVVTLPHFPKPISAQGATFLAALLTKSTLVVLLVTGFGSLVRERDILVGLRGLRLPGRVVDLAYLMLRNISLVRDELLRLVRARDSRGRPRGLRAVSTAAGISRVLLIRLGQRAELQAAALYARGFAGTLRVVDATALSRGEAGLLIVLAVGLGWLVCGSWL